MELLDPRLTSFLETLLPPADPVQAEMEQQAAAENFPIVGPLVGHILFVMARLIGARRVFELGSGFGYSALFFARAVGPQGEVWCTDRAEAHRRRAQEYLTRAGVWDRIHFRVGEALQVLEEVGGTWDVIFCDIDKDAYPECIDIAYRHVRPGGLFMADNALWHGRVLPGADDGSRATARIRAFNQKLARHPGFSFFIIPIRDGLSVALRK